MTNQMSTRYPNGPGPDGIAALIKTSGVPANDSGNDGDLATDPATGEIYTKVNGTWYITTERDDIEQP